LSLSLKTTGKPGIDSYRYPHLGVVGFRFGSTQWCTQIDPQHAIGKPGFVPVQKKNEESL